MDDLRGKRVYDDRGAETTELLVAAAPGLVRVAVSDGRVGEFGVARDCAAADLSVADDPHSAEGYGLAVATDEDVLLAESGHVEDLGPTGFGQAVAVTVRDGRPIAAGPQDRLATHGGDGWTDIGGLAAPVTALDGDLVGTDAGVLRLVGDELQPAGLADVTDVARVAGIPLVATRSGLYELGNGWLDVLEGGFGLVEGAPDGRAHAGGEAGFYDRIDGVWEPLGLPVDDPVAAIAYGPRTYLLTDAGDLLIEDGSNWSDHPLGLAEVRAAAAVRHRSV